MMRGMIKWRAVGRVGRASERKKRTTCPARAHEPERTMRPPLAQVLHLRSQCISFMVEHFAEVARTDSFKELISAEHRTLVMLVLDEVAHRIPPRVGSVPE